MKTGTMTAIGLFLVAGAVFLVATQEDRISADDVESAEVALPGAEVPAGNSVTAVEYETVRPAHAVKSVRASRPAAEEKKTAAPQAKKDPRVKYQGTDSSHRYGFQLIDESMTPVTGKGSVGFVGRINGNSFTVRIPKEVQQNSLQLRIVDRKTKEEKIVSLPFTAELGKPGYAPVMEIDFENAENYTAESNPQVAAVFP